VAAEIDGQPVELGHARQRSVLAVLLMEANHTVPMAHLAERVWGEGLPRSRYTALYSYLSRLRSALAPASDARIARRAGGYALLVAPAAIDLLRFQDLVGRARAAAADAAVDLYDQALRLWRGDAFAGLDAPWLNSMRDALHRQRLAAELDRDDIRLRRGDAGLLDELLVRSATHPLDERLAAQLMLALRGSGRTAEALDHYQTMRKRLADELGADPGPALDRTHQAILRGEVEPSVGPPPHTPAHLPRDVAAFAGRDSELARLERFLAAGGTNPATVVITAVLGTAGVGKTALAVHWAHRISHRFPDGQLYVNLCGFDPGGSPLDPASVISGFLEALGTQPHQMPASLSAQIGLYRSLLAGKRMLILLDNARDSEQVRPLLPGARDCLVLVTSRDQLTGLAAVDGARLVPLNLLPPAEAHQMLTARLGPERVATEPDATEEILARCAGLPLALAVVAAHAASRPHFSLAALVEELRGTERSLDAFDTGDAATDARTVFSWSYRILSAPAARLFRLLGLHPGPDLTAATAASLAGLTAREARHLLAELCRAHLITEHVPGRYTSHDLLRAYAAELAEAHEAEAERREAVHRLLDYYLHTAYAAERLLNAHRDPITLSPPRVAPEHLVDDGRASAWFAAERSTLLAAVQHAASTGWDTHAWQLAWSLTTFFDRRAYWYDHIAVWRAALAATERLADPDVQALAHRELANASIEPGLLDQAETHLRRALDLWRSVGNRSKEAHIHSSLAILWERKGDPARALEHARQALAIQETTGHPTGLGLFLNLVGWFLAQVGDHASALTYCRRALSLLQETNHRFGEASAWDSLGFIYHHLGQHGGAIACYRQALRLFRELDDPVAVALILTHLGEVHNDAGDPESARTAWAEALTILAGIGHADADSLRERLRTLPGDAVMV
jgi:DNA-binding SARP family transcriptional activator/Tfp pilus assembly protein PilF